MVKNVLNNLYNRILLHFEQYTVYDKIYKIGSYVFIGYFLCMFLVMFFFDNYINTQNVISVFAYFLMIIFTIAVIIEYFFLIKTLYEKKWFKVFIVLIGGFSYKLAEIHTDHIINNFTGIDPSYLPAASSALVTISLVYIWLLVLASFIGIYIIFFGFIFTGKNKTTDSDLKFWKIMGRMLGLYVVFMILLATITKLGNKKSIMESLSQNIVLSTEYFGKSRCKNNNDSSSLYAELPRGLVSIYNPINKEFTIKKCKK